MPNKTPPLSQTPPLEWAAAGIGLLFLLFLLGAIGYDGVTGASRHPPAISIKLGPITKVGSTYVVTFEAINRGGGTAAALEIEGQLSTDGKIVETGSATIDYVPGHGKAGGGIFFAHDPSRLTLDVRPTGFQTP